ncbi:MAG TPA: ABC transporter permease subunit [Stellaceae bacterium]|jgi:NitT/TauT family transport system permease protein/taurine transport system permease protein|nr:ABC transporter permease subunit [Stellaceae bacterium]
MASEPLAAATTRRVVQASGERFWSPAVTRCAIIVGLLLAWEILPRMGVISRLFVPSLSETLQVVVTDRAEYAEALWVTLGEVCAGLVIACGGGILGGALLGSVAVLRRLFLPVASSIYAVPVVILYPILTVWLGIGPESKIAFAGLYGFFPTMLATAAGIRTIDPNYLLAARSMGATLPQQILRVIIPASIPTVLAGLRLGGVLVIVGVVVSEMLTSTAGIGYLVTRYRTVLDSAHVFAAVLLIVLLTLLFDSGTRLLERRTAIWRPQSRDGSPRASRAASIAPAQ